MEAYMKRVTQNSSHILKFLWLHATENSSNVGE